MAVLIADDLASGRKYHRALLRMHGSRADDSFVEAGTLEEAIKAVRDNDIEFVVLDLNFRDSSERGVDALRKFLDQTRISPLKVYVCTADSDNPELVEACLALGVAGVSNSGQPPWAGPAPTFTAGQLELLDKRVAETTRKTIREEFVVLQREQAERDKIKQAEGILTALRVVAGVLAGALGTWLLNVGLPPALKAFFLTVASWIAGNKSGP